MKLMEGKHKCRPGPKIVEGLDFLVIKNSLKLLKETKCFSSSVSVTSSHT